VIAVTSAVRSLVICVYSGNALPGAPARLGYSASLIWVSASIGCCAATAGVMPYCAADAPQRYIAMHTFVTASPMSW